MKQINVNSELLVTQRLPDSSGYTWTLASRLGEMLQMAEELFGQRDISYTILGVEFIVGIPQIWYPGNCKHVVIQLNQYAATDMLQACYQMAHETVHLLSPTGGNSANNFEEGVACYFAAYYLKNKLNASNWEPTLQSYKQALALITPRLDEDIYCVRRLREHQPSFSEISDKQIRAEFPNLTLGNVNFLIKKFDRNSGSEALEVPPFIHTKN